MKRVECRGLTLGSGLPKIAVPVTATDRASIIHEAAEAAASGADLLEFRADAWAETTNPEALTDLLQKMRGEVGDFPVLFTFRTKAEGGWMDLAEGEYRELVRTAIASGAIDLLDLEQEREDTPTLLETAHRAGIPVILSYHDFQHTPSVDALTERLKAMKESGADIAKIASMPEERGDVTRVLQASALARESLDLPFLLISMGEKGLPARLSGERLGSCITFGCLPGRESAPGQMNVVDLRKKLEELHTMYEAEQQLFLIGFMGCGKTTVGELLEKKTGRSMLEMDQTIEAEEGRSIPQIFEENGEPYFRELETAMIAGLYEKRPMIVSCGGGAALREGNAALMHALGKTVLLTAKPETILARLTGESENRPNIRNRMTLEGVTELMNTRWPKYQAAADLVVETDGKTPEEIAEEILGENLGIAKSEKTL